MTREYNKYTKPIMDELNKKFKFLTKLNDNEWLIQSNPKSLMEAYRVTVTDNCHIVMSGDYDGIMVRPYGNDGFLPNWMAGAHTISYFAEKVMAANRYHRCKEYSEDEAIEELEDIKKSMIDEDEPEESKKRAKDFDSIVNYSSTENEHGYWDLISELQTKLDLYDLCEYDPTVYTNQFKWQHKCLIFWANKVLEGAFEENGK